MLTGSSPRVRGTPRPPSPLARTVHPRVCGERAFVRPCLVRFIPACAGNARYRHYRDEVDRFIPACAGNAICCARPAMIRFIPACAGNAAEVAALPRFIPACAGNAGGAMADGSSPRVRGTRELRGATGSKRFIPACAGNARLQISLDGPDRGSSPRVRGTPDLHQGARRFIPACAGNAGQRIPVCRPVHPRVCGERVPADAPLVPHSGSSPRVRGTRRPHTPRSRCCRFIPACAGNAERRSGVPRKSPVHPRVCGERPSFGIFTELVAGSSPRVRGTRAQASFARPLRFIPACAGNAPHPGRSQN